MSTPNYRKEFCTQCGCFVSHHGWDSGAKVFRCDTCCCPCERPADDPQMAHIRRDYVISLVTLVVLLTATVAYLAVAFVNGWWAR